MYIANQTPLAESFSVDKIDMLSHTHHIYRQADTTKTVEKNQLIHTFLRAPQTAPPSLRYLFHYNNQTGQVGAQTR
jgi:hypothetical protein